MYGKVRQQHNIFALWGIQGCVANEIFTSDYCMGGQITARKAAIRK